MKNEKSQVNRSKANVSIQWVQCGYKIFRHESIHFSPVLYEYCGAIICWVTLQYEYLLEHTQQILIILCSNYCTPCFLLCWVEIKPQSSVPTLSSAWFSLIEDKYLKQYCLWFWEILYVSWISWAHQVGRYYSKGRWASVLGISVCLKFSS